MGAVPGYGKGLQDVLGLATIGQPERSKGYYVASVVELLSSIAATTSSFDGGIIEIPSALLNDRDKSRLRRFLDGDTTNSGIDDSLLQHLRRFRVEYRLDEGLFSKMVLNTIAQDDVPLKVMQSLKFQVLRTCIEHAEARHDLSQRRDIWINHLKSECRHFNSYANVLGEALYKTSFGDKVTLLETVKASLNSCVPSDVNAATKQAATQAALNAVDQLGTHPFLSHLLPVYGYFASRVGSGLNGIPASSSTSSSMLPPSSSMYLLRKFYGQEHAVAMLTKALGSTRYKDGCPLGTFLLHDPMTLYWEDFAAEVSWLLYGTKNLSLRLDLSAEVDILLMSANGKGKLFELFDDVRKRPFCVVLLEKVDQAHESVIDALCCTLEGANIDFSGTTFIMISVSGSVSHINDKCSVLSLLLKNPERKFIDLASYDSGITGTCSCIQSLKEVKACLSPRIWDLLDDVVFIGGTTLCSVMAYGRVILREIAARFCGGRLVIYPSESALSAILCHSDYIKTMPAVKRWMEENVVPKLRQMADNGCIDENSIVFIDTFVGTTDLSYRVEKIDVYQVDNMANKFSRLADDWTDLYGVGKVLENNVKTLRTRLHELLMAFNANVNVETTSIQQVIEFVDNALEAAHDIDSKKEIFFSSADKVDAIPRAGSKRLSNLATSPSTEPEIIQIVRKAFKKIDESKNTRFPASYLLLGLQDDSKMELDKHFKDDGVVVVKSNMSSFNHSNWLCVVDALRENPRSILFLDRVEEAEMSIFGLLMSSLAHGTALDKDGKLVHLGKTVILIASNVGNKHVMTYFVKNVIKNRGLAVQDGRRDLHGPSLSQEGPRFRHELLCKVDEMIIFDPCACEQLNSLARIPIISLREGHNHEIGFDFNCLFGRGFDLKDKEKWYKPIYSLLKIALKAISGNGV